MQKAIRIAALLIVLASLAWTIWLVAFGGFDTTVLGLRIRSNNPQRVLILTIAGVVVFLLAGGRIPLAAALRRIGSLGPILARHPGWIVAALASCATVLAASYSTRIAGGSDAYGYVSQAELWLQRDLKMEQPWVAAMPFPNKEWTFAPLGYRPADGEPAIVPTYSPGLPILMAAAKWIGGHCGIFHVVPLAFGLAVLATYGLGCRLVSPAAGAIAAWFIATSPIALEVAVEALTDVPVMAAWSLAFYFGIGRGARSAACAGFCAGAGILIRPNLVPLALPLGVWPLLRADRGTLQTRLRDAIAFSVGALPGIAGVALINTHLYGSAGASGYGSLADGFAAAHVLPNLRRFVLWIVETQSPLALVGLVALFVPVQRVWPGVRDRRMFAIIVLFIALLWAQYSAYLEFDSAGYLRFLLPGWPLMMLGLAAVLLAFARRGGIVARALVGVTVVALGLWTFNVAVRRDVFEQRQAARHDAPLGQVVRAHTDSNSVILALHRSGSLRYYAGRITARYDMLDPQWLDRFAAWLTERGVHVYAVLDEREAAEAKGRFAGQRLGSAFERPVLIYAPVGVALFDLSKPDGSGKPVVVHERPDDRAHCNPPAPPPRPLVLSENVVTVTPATPRNWLSNSR